MAKEVASLEVTSLEIFEIFFSLFFGILGNFKRFHEKKISKILRCDVTSEVTGRWPRK